jgi:hypothetical protein
MTKKIGRNEKILFTDLKIVIDAKVDTGAWRSSLHVDGYEIVDGKLVFWIGDKKNCYIYEKYKTIKVKSSFGKTQKRFLVKLKMKLGEKNYNVLVSLSNRKNMKFPCLIGRRFLQRFNFIVDVRKKNLHDRLKEV